MRLKLDLHPIYNDAGRIEEALRKVIDEAVDKRAKEVEIIPGKGSGALKKSVLRFLLRPEVKARYHRLEKDSDNWGRLFVHFRHDRPEPTTGVKSGTDVPTIGAPCACCESPIMLPVPENEEELSIKMVCVVCGSPNRLTILRCQRGTRRVRVELDYGEG